MTEIPAVPDREARRARREAEWARRDAEAGQRARLDARIDDAAAAAPSVLPGEVGETLAAVLAAMKPFRAADGHLSLSAVGRSSDEVVALAEAILALPTDAVRVVPATLNSELKVGAVPDTAGRCGDIGDLLFNKRYCCELRAGHAGWHREGVTEWSGVVAHRAASEVPDTGQAREPVELVGLRARIAAAFADVDNLAGEPPSREQLDQAHIAACVALNIGQDQPSGDNAEETPDA